MTASEFTFLALGLVLGVAAGAALVEVLRARPPAARYVRVTVMEDAIPRRRASTLADPSQGRSPAPLPSMAPARGGPGDRRTDDRVDPGRRERRTAVRSATETAPSWIATGVPAHDGQRAVRAMVGIPISGGNDPTFAAVRMGTTHGLLETVPVAAVDTLAGSHVRSMTAVLDRPRASGETSPVQTSSGETSPGETTWPGAANPGAETSLPATDGPLQDSSGPCVEARRLSDERCELASRARTQAVAAEAALRAAQRACDGHELAASAAASTADVRAVRLAKDEAQQRFHAARTGAGTDEALEAAARDWLQDINRINSESREATATMVRELEAARAIGANLERSSLGADAARIAAETAEAVCLAAREAVATCEQAEADGNAAVRSPTSPSEGPPRPDEGKRPEAALGRTGTPRIFRLLRGDRAAMADIVAELGGDDAEDGRRWQVALTALVEAILADSIEASALNSRPSIPSGGS